MKTNVGAEVSDTAVQVITTYHRCRCGRDLCIFDRARSRFKDPNSAIRRLRRITRRNGFVFVDGATKCPVCGASLGETAAIDRESNPIESEVVEGEFGRVTRTVLGQKKGALPT